MIMIRYFLLGFVLLFAQNSFAQQINIATYNVRYKNSGDEKNGNGWDQRMPVITDIIKFHDFDIFGAQEVLQQQLNDLNSNLQGYGHVGVGRDDGKQAGEHAMIFYKKDKFKLLDSGNFWLSTHDDVPNKGWDAALPRICSWGAFQHLASGRKFYFFNTHFDHVGIVARRESAKLILRKINTIAGSNPTILTGDFNVDQTNEIYGILTGQQLSDAFEVTAFRYATNGTFNHFDINTKTNSRIDHILLSKSIKVKRYGVLTDTYRGAGKENADVSTSGNFPKEVSLQRYEARLPSDHFPVMAVIDLNP